MNLLVSNSKLILAGIVILVFIISGAYTYFIKNELEKLQREYIEQSQKLAIEKANNLICHTNLNKQNSDIEEMKNDYENKLLDFQNWKNKEFESKYKELEKFKEIKSNECEDIKNLINHVRSIKL